MASPISWKHLGLLGRSPFELTHPLGTAYASLALSNNAVEGFNGVSRVNRSSNVLWVVNRGEIVPMCPPRATDLRILTIPSVRELI